MFTVKAVLDLAKRQIGYKETGDNHTKYASYFDNTAWQWFNTKKQGSAWCAIFICWLYCQNEIMGPSKAYTMLGCPKNKNDNCAAGVPYLWSYLKAKGYHVTSPKAGDIIFLNGNKHVGIVEKVDANKVYTIEGNKSNAVKRSSYGLTSKSIYGYMRVPYNAETTTDSGKTNSKVASAAVIDQIARDCIKGKYGTYPLRKQKVNALGYGSIYTQVQKRVNMILYGR